MKALTKTDFHFDGQKSVYHGKVRDVYDINDDLLVMVATDRISAFDVVLPKGIPFKGQVLNQIAAKFLDTTTDICPNWKLATPDPMVTVGLKCEGFRVEMIIRSILTGLPRDLRCEVARRYAREPAFPRAYHHPYYKGRRGSRHEYL